jgi:quercetin dioxygenase-like cupin family protein
MFQRHRFNSSFFAALRSKAQPGEGEYMGPGRRLRFVAVITALAGAVTAVVLASPPSGILSGTVVARATFQDPVDIKIKVNDGRQEVFHVPNAGETVMQQIIIGPGGQTGWHSHPGPVVVLVKSGVLTFFARESAGCATRSYSAGQAFVDSGQGHVHMAANQSLTENVELWVTYFDVPPGGAFRIDVPNPGGCPL